MSINIPFLPKLQLATVVLVAIVIVACVLQIVSDGEFANDLFATAFPLSVVALVIEYAASKS